MYGLYGYSRVDLGSPNFFFVEKKYFRDLQPGVEKGSNHTHHTLLGGVFILGWKKGVYGLAKYTLIYEEYSYKQFIKNIA